MFGLTSPEGYCIQQNLPILDGKITNAKHAAPPSINDAHNIRFLPALEKKNRKGGGNIHHYIVPFTDLTDDWQLP